ncbi:unnamed protein product [Vicia faba]|uniref:Uncharacterized protein n=1 Tax=Vicia faba TaxID=3906 RepID=A0AAV1B0D9_VICFA|nr:unnamed protein product [Vicia faba]
MLLSFGSMGRFYKAQLIEIALGLENSEQRFLWIVRSELDSEELNLEDLLPEGLLERTKENGMVVALEMNKSKDGFVSRIQLGDRIKELMDSYKGNKIRQMILKTKIGSKEARDQSGCSFVHLTKLTQLFKQKERTSSS